MERFDQPLLVVYGDYYEFSGNTIFGGNFQFGKEACKETQVENGYQYVDSEPMVTGDSLTEVKEKLKKMFSKGNVDNYLAEIIGKKGRVIEGITNEWVRKGKIYCEYAHRPLWTVLHEAGIYKASESNWNQQIQ